MYRLCNLALVSEATEKPRLERHYAAEQWARSLANSVPDTLVLAVLLAAALLLAIRAYRRRRHKPRSAPENLEGLAGEKRAGKTNR